MSPEKLEVYLIYIYNNNSWIYIRFSYIYLNNEITVMYISTTKLAPS